MSSSEMHADTQKTLKQRVLRLFGRKTRGDCGTYHFAQGREPASRIALVNHLATLYGYDSYLEIGVRNRADMFNRIICSQKTAVDPDPNAKADFVLTSDEYFRQNPDARFDLIFIDGDHTGAQVARDIDNALAALNPGGAILLHDLNPPTAFHARVNYEADGDFPEWNGTSWEGFAAHRASRKDLEMYVVDTDWGVGFLRPGRQLTYDGPVTGYDALEANRSEILNLISVREFLQRHPRKRRAWSPLDRFLA